MASLTRSQSMGSESSDASGASGASGFSDNSNQSATNSSGGGGGRAQQEDEVLDENQSILKGVFGVLFTLSKEKVDSSKRFVVLKIVLDYVQLLYLVASPSYGWSIDPNLWVWKVVSYLNFQNPIINQGYGFYIGILYTVSVVLLISAALCVWVGYCFQQQRFPFVWPIQVLRLFVSVFFMVFYIASLGVFLVAINCDWFSGKPYFMTAFPTQQCLQMPHIIHMTVAVILALLFISITLALTAADFEQNPVSDRWLASATSTVEVRAVLVRTVATLAFSLLQDLRKPQTLLVAVSMFYACWSFIRWEPHMFHWMNHVRAGLYGSLSWAAFLLLVLTFKGPDDKAFATSCTTTMVAGLIPTWLLFMGISYVRYRWYYKRALAAFTAAPPDANLREVWRWGDPQAVEMCARICRTLDADDDEKQDEASVKMAERMLKGGMSFFSSKAEMVIMYANFMIEVSKQTQAGHSQLVAAKNLKPNIVQQFAIFVREQVHMQAAQTHASGEASTDLVSYVEFQKHQRLVVRCHRNALYATRNFWRLLMNTEVSFTALSKAFNAIEDSHARADKTYKTVLERYSSSAKVLRMYASFLEEVKNDPWTAAYYMAESEKLEEQQSAAENSALLGGDSGGGGQVDARNSPVAVINAQGIIQMANKLLLNLYGYKRGEMDGKNVSMLMPQPFSGRHNTYLRNYLTTGKAKVLDGVREVLGLHRERYVFPTRLLVTKISGDGMDSVFMGIFKTMEDDHTLVRAYVAPGGSVLCADMRFMDWFGRNPSELQGKPFHSLAMEQGQLEQLVSLAAESSEEYLNAGNVAAHGVHIMHKYSSPVECDVVVKLGGTETQRVLIYNIRRKCSNDLMLACDSRGKVAYCTTDIAAMLHYQPRQVHGMPLQKLISQPFAQLHNKWMRTQNPRIPTGSCRGAFTVIMSDADGVTGVPVKCHITEREVEEKSYFVITFEASSFEEGISQTRLRLKLDETRPGVVADLPMEDKLEQTVSQAFSEDGEAANPKTASRNDMGAFGQRLSMYANRHISSFIDVFCNAREKEGGTVASCSQLLEDMVEIVRQKPGMVFRVGVHPPVDEAKLAALAPASTTTKQEVDEKTGVKVINVHAMERQMLQRETKPAILRIEIVKVGEGEEAPEDIYIELFNANACTGVLEINKSGTITKPSSSSMHQPGPLFGVVSRAMNTRSIRKYIKLPPKGSAIREFMAANGKQKSKGALKNSFDAKAIGPQKIMEGAHCDGRPLQLEVQCIAKESESGAHHRYLLRVKLHKPGFGPPDFPKLVAELKAAYIPNGPIAIGGMPVATRPPAGFVNDDFDEDEEDEDDGRGEQVLTLRNANLGGMASKPAGDKANGAGDGGSDADSTQVLREEGQLPGSGPASPNRNSEDLMGELGDMADGMADDDMADEPTGGGLAGKIARGDSLERAHHKPSDSARPSFDDNGLPISTKGVRVLAPMESIDEAPRKGRTSFFIEGGTGAGDRGPVPVRRAEKSFPAKAPSETSSADNSEAEGSQSEISSMAGSQAVQQTDHNDYQRGKRMKRLQNLLTSRKAQSVIVRFQQHSIVVTLMLLTAHIVCFCTLLMAINTQKDNLTELKTAGTGVEAMHSVTLWTRVMDSLYKNYTAGAVNMSTPLYQPGDKADFVARLQADINRFENVHHGVYLGFQKLRRLPDTSTYKLRTIWEAPVQVTRTWVDTTMSYEEDVNMTLWQLGNDFIAAAREIMSNSDVLTDGGTLELSSDKNWYFVIQNGPWSLFTAYKAMLDALVIRSMEQIKSLRVTIMILLVIEACVLVVAALVYIVLLLSKVGTHRFHIYSIFLVVPNGLLRALASKKVAIDEDMEDEEEEEAPQAQKQKAQASQGPSDAIKWHSQALGGGKDKPTEQAAKTPTSGSNRMWTRVMKLFAGSGNNITALAASSKKRLVKSPFDGMQLLIPFILWALMIIIIYPISYMTLATLGTPVTMVNVANFLTFRVRRNVFFANELCSMTDDTSKASASADLAARIVDMVTEWQASMYGPTAAQAATEPHFANAESFTFQGLIDQNLLYRDRVCLRTDLNVQLFEPDCFVDGDQYYQISIGGLASMISRSIVECMALTNDAYADINLTSTRLDFMWRVGLFDMGDALSVLQTDAQSFADAKLTEVLTINVVLLVLSILLALFFIFFMVQPFLQRTIKESKRVAELLSQLPADINVENLVVVALGHGAKPDKAAADDAAAGAGSGKGDGMGSGKGAGFDDDDKSSVAGSELD